MPEKCLRRRPGIPAIPACHWPAGREAEGRELEWPRLGVTTQPMALLLWEQTGPFLHTDPCREGREQKQHSQPGCPVKASVFSLWKRHNRSSRRCRSIPSAAPGRSLHLRSCCAAVPAAQTVNTSSHCTAQLTNAYKTVGAFHMQVWGGGGVVLLFQGNVLRQLHRERHPGPAKWQYEESMQTKAKR